MIIALIGIDGSGKTTQGILLSKVLKSYGYKVKYMYAGNTGIKIGQKYAFYLSLPVDIIYHKLLKIEAKPQIENTWLFRMLTKLESFLLFLNYLVFILSKIIIYKKLYHIIIADRYVYDYLISSMLQKKFSKMCANILLRIVPRPEAIFLLDVDAHVAYKRKCGERSINELKMLRTFYLHFLKRLGGYLINTGNKKKEEVLELILRECLKLMPNSALKLNDHHRS